MGYRYNCRFLLLAVLLVAVGPLAGCRSGPHTVRAQSSVDVRSYEADLSLDPESRRLDARVKSIVRHPDTTEMLRFHLVGLTIDSVRVSGQVTEFERDGDRLRIPAAADTVSNVEIFYHGVPSVGLYRRTYNGQAVVFTDSWPNRARGWLPSVDVPSDPARFRVSLRVPIGSETVANGQQVSVDTLDGFVRTTWDLSAAAPTYTMAFAVSDFAPTCTNGRDGLPICYYLLASDSARADQLRRTPETLDFLSGVFGPYPFDNYQVVQIPIQYGGMENAALPFLRAEFFDMPGRAEDTQVHEAVHQWFGNRVVLARWRDLWLSEGVATYYTTRFYEHEDGREAARRRWTQMVDIDPAELGETVLVPDGPVNPGEFLTWVPYRKGASVLHLFRLVMGRDNFDAAMRETFARYSGRPLSTPLFVDILSSHTDVDLSDIVRYWVYGADIPTLTATWHPGDTRLSWAVEDDDGTLDGVPFELQIMDGGSPVYVSAAEGSYTLENGDVEGAPRVRPVGILMHVRTTDE